ncbi:MAG: LytR/AlgR family response regulator transcription factor [Gemmatimonadaceae bacterium]
MKIRCLVVDDEPLGRERIVSLLSALPDAEVVGESETGSAAIAAIEALTPDLLFLDVQMPEVDGFGVLASVDRSHVPAVIFVTAYDEYALRAFEVYAQDYLLKPFDPDRFYSAFQRAAHRIRTERASDTNSRLVALLDNIDRDRPRRSRIAIRSGGSVFFLPVEEIDWLEAADNYVRIHAKGETYIVRQTLQRMEDSLAPSAFVRIHRSSIVNVGRIKEIQPWFGGEYVVLLRDGTKLHTSRRYRARLESLME